MCSSARARASAFIGNRKQPCVPESLQAQLFAQTYAIVFLSPTQFWGIFHKSQLCSHMPTIPPARHAPALLHPLSRDHQAHKAQHQPEGTVHKSSSGTRAVDDSGLQRKTRAAAFPSSWHHELPFKTEHKDCVAAKAAASH